MTNEERLQKTIRFEKTDKILFAPIIQQFAASYTGISQKDYLDPEKAEKAYEKTFNELGGWDIVAPPMMFADGETNFVLRQLLPGRDLPDNMANQFIEEEVMLPEDYDYVIRNGFNALLKRLQKRTHPDKEPPGDRNRFKANLDTKIKETRDKWLSRGVTFLSSHVMGSHPFEFFSFHRSLAKFSLDLRRMPEKVKDAINACVPDMVNNAKKAVEKSNIPRVSVANSRGSCIFINSNLFEELVLPSWLDLVLTMDEANIDVIFHCDTDWFRFLHYFKDFPARRCILQLDGATNIFKAKEILKNHMAIHGDVPATLLTLGTPEQVTEYCKRLIGVAGEGGGFILSSGCSTPYDSKIENVRAMVKAGNELTWY